MSELDVRSVLRGALRGPPGPQSLQPDAEQWSALCSRMFSGNVPGVLAAAVEAESVVVDEPRRRRLFDQMVVRLVNDLRAESECVRVTALLRDAGIRTVVLKGLAVAHLDYADPSHRSTNDVDLLVRPDDLGPATELLTDSGFRRDLPERRPGFDRRFAKDVTMYGPRRVEVDLHRTLLRGPFGAAIDLDELWEHQEHLEVAGLPRRGALDRPSRLLHACYTVAVADARPTLANHCDVALLASDPALDWDAVRSRAERWRAWGVVVDGVAAASRTTGVALEVPIRGTRDRSQERWRSLYRSGGGSLVATTAGMARALGPAAAARYLRDLAFPSAAYRRGRRDAGRPSELRAAVGALRAGYRRPPT